MLGNIYKTETLLQIKTLLNLIFKYKEETRNQINMLRKDIEPYLKQLKQNDQLIEALLTDRTDLNNDALFVYIPYGGNPVVYKYGKRIDNSEMSNLSISWAKDNPYNIDITVDNYN